MANTSIFKTVEGKRHVLGYYETLLTEWHQPSKQFYVKTTFGDTFIIESGNKKAPAIILLHGSGSNSAMWTADVHELSKSYHVFAFDIIGECGNSSESRPAFKNENYSNWVSEIVEKLALTKVSIIGCSLGGWIAMDYAIKHPNKVDKLILLATAGITQVKLKTVFWILFTSILGRWGFNKLNKIVYGNLSVDEQVLEFTSLIKKNYKPRTDVLPILTNEALQRIIPSTLFIGGAHDCFYDSRKTVMRLKENVINVQCIVQENLGHVLINQTDKILNFLNDK
jgi:pimeloyl-ACP methyl ester carboxylesterase